MNRVEILDQFFDTSDVHTTEYETAVMHEAEMQEDEMEDEMQRDGAVMKNYLKLIEEIMLQAQWTTSDSCFKPPKFNHRQCKYLADKLKQAVERAKSFLVPFIDAVERAQPFLVLSIDGRYCTEMSSTPEEMARFLDTCKQLYASAELVQSFIQDCCRGFWVRSALSLCNVSEHVSSIGFDLELCRIVFSNVGKDRGASESSLSPKEIDELAKRGVETVRREALDDNRALLEKVEALCRSSESRREERVLGKRLVAALAPSAAGDGYYDDDIRSVSQIGKLGIGANGVVHRGIWYESVDVAKKVLYGDDKFSQREKFIQARLSHFNVTFLFCYGEEDENKTTLLMDLMQGNLFDLIGKRMKRGRAFPFPILVAVDIMLQVGVGMQYVHELEIVHRDLKPENIFTRGVKRTEFVLTKVGDFGSAKVVEENQTMTTMMGTPRYMAPEMLMFSHIKRPENEIFKILEKPYHGVMKEHPYKCDIYSFAMLCFVILTGKQPFSSEVLGKVIGEHTLRGVKPVIPEWCPKNLKVLIERCWSQDVNERPCFGDICKELRYIKFLILMTGLEDKQTLHLRQPHERDRREGESFFGRWSGDISYEEELAPSTQEDRESQFSENCKVFADWKLEQDERIARIGDGAGPGFLQNMDDLVLEQVIAEGGEAQIYTAHGGLVVKVYREENLVKLFRTFDTAFLNAFDSDSHRLSPLCLIKGGALLTDSRVRNRFGIVMGRKWGALRDLLNWHLTNQLERMKNATKMDIVFTNLGRVLSENQVLVMMLRIAKDMKCLHNQSPPILHRDLKAANVLVQGPELPFLDGGFEVTVCDFGNSSVLGTGFWRAPEILSCILNRKREPSAKIMLAITDKCDVYSYGMTCYELVTGHTPFFGYYMSDMHRIIEGERPHLPPDLHPVIRSVIDSCWDPIPSKRPSFNDIVDILSPQSVYVPAN